MSDWAMVDCEVRARLYPSSFSIPARILREGLSPGNFVRVVYAAAALADPANDLVHRHGLHGRARIPELPTGEQLWVHILEIRGPRYLGEVTSQPRIVPVRYGQRLEFGPEHICSWEPS